MRTVEKGYLSFMIWSLAWDKEYIETGLVCRELLCDFLRSLDNPKMEDLTLDNEVILISDTLMNLVDRILRIARYYTVYESTVYSASLLKPVLEVLAKLPEFDILIYALLQFLTIEEDEFARKDDESLAHITLEMLISVVQKLCELARI